MKYVLVSKFGLGNLIFSVCMLNNAIAEKDFLFTMFWLVTVFINCVLCFDKEDKNAR